MPPRLLALLIGGLLPALCAPAPVLAAPANVRLRVEGAGATLLPRTALRTDTRSVNKDGQPGHTCSGTTAAGALEIGTAGDWGGSWFDGLGYSVERIFGEAHVFPDPDFFELWVNNRSSATGICQTELQEGDDVLFIVARCEFDPATFRCTNPPVLPLGLFAPRTALGGTPFNVSVVEYSPTGTAGPVAGATVAGGDAPAITDARGQATVIAGAGGERALRATKPNRAPSASEPVCVTSGADELCGSAAAEQQSRCATSGHDGRCGTVDRTAPRAGVVGIAEGQRFRRGRGPRVLRARVADDPSGLHAVKLRLTRTVRGRCSYFSGRSERFRRIPGGRCGAWRGFWFGVGDRAELSYLLPGRLPRGRYVLDVNAVDRAFNRDDQRRRAGNRVVFHVG